MGEASPGFATATTAAALVMSPDNGKGVSSRDFPGSQVRHRYESAIAAPSGTGEQRSVAASFRGGVVVIIVEHRVQGNAATTTTVHAGLEDPTTSCRSSLYQICERM